MEKSYCTRCFKPASLMCRRCFQVYCSTLCQATDWTVHKTICIEMPSLAPLNGFVTLGRSNVQSRLNMSKMKHLNDEGRIRDIYDIDETRRLPKQHLTAFTPSVENATKTVLQQVRLTEQFNTYGDEHNIHISTQKTTFGEIIREQSKHSEKSKKTIVNVKEKETTDSNSFKAEIINRNEWVSHHVPPMRNWFVATLEFIDVNDSSVIWISEKCYETEIAGLHSEMLQYMMSNDCCKNNDIAVGKLVIVDSGETAYRAEILKVYQSDRQTALLRFIDFGNVESADCEKLYKASPAALNCKAYGFRVRTNQMWTTKDIDTVLNIRIISAKTSAGYYIAEVQKKANANSKNDFPARLEALEPVGIDSQAENTPLPPSPPQSPADRKESTFCIAKKNEKDKEQSEQQPVNLAMSQLTITSSKTMAQKCQIADETKCMSKKIPVLKDLGIIPLSTGANVSLTIVDKSLLGSEGYITVFDAGNDVYDFQFNLNKVIKYCEAQSKNNLTGYSPKCGEVCLAIYDSDQQWYRAVCLREFDGDFYQILFIDYGNKSMVKSGSIMALPKDFMFPTIVNRCYIRESLQGKLTETNIINGIVEKRDNCFHLIDVI